MHTCGDSDWSESPLFYIYMRLSVIGIQPYMIGLQLSINNNIYLIFSILTHMQVFVSHLIQTPIIKMIGIIADLYKILKFLQFHLLKGY